MLGAACIRVTSSFLIKGQANLLPVLPCSCHRLAQGAGCSLTLALYWEMFADATTAAYLFPINTLRNYAALMVRWPREECRCGRSGCVNKCEARGTP